MLMPVMVAANPMVSACTSRPVIPKTPRATRIPTPPGTMAMGSTRIRLKKSTNTRRIPTAVNAKAKLMSEMMVRALAAAKWAPPMAKKS